MLQEYRQELEEELSEVNVEIRRLQKLDDEEKKD